MNNNKTPLPGLDNLTRGACLTGLTPIKPFKAMENLHDKQSKASKQSTEKENNDLTHEAASFARQNHDQHRSILLEGLYQRSREDLIKGFLIEMNAKNQAYYFILERGYFDAFRQYYKPGP